MRPGLITLMCIMLSSMLAFGMVGCAKRDDTRILGHWRAERLKMMSLNIPISPEFIISKDALAAVGADLQLPITSMSYNGDEVTLNTMGGLGLSFYFESNDRMYFDVPLLGKIYYQRVKPVPQDMQNADATKAKPATTISAPAMPSQRTVPVSPGPAMATIPGAGSPQQVAVPANGIKPDHVQAVKVNADEPTLSTAAPKLDAVSGELQRLVRAAEREMDQGNLGAAQSMLTGAQRIDRSHPMVDYNLAILTMKQGDSEGAIRHLKDAFGHGFRAFVLLDANPDLAALKSDARYNVLVAKYK